MRKQAPRQEKSKWSFGSSSASPGLRVGRPELLALIDALPQRLTADELAALSASWAETGLFETASGEIDGVEWAASLRLVSLGHADEPKVCGAATAETHISYGTLVMAH